MAQKSLNEAQMREYVESEVRKALMNESKDTILTESINEMMEEGLVDENAIEWLGKLLGRNSGNGGGLLGGIEAEGIIGAILGRFFAPLLRRILDKLGIDADGPFGRLLTNAGSMAIGGYIGQKVGKKWDPIGIDNITSGSQGTATGGGTSGGR